MTCPFYTIGHGRRPTYEFIDLLRGVRAAFVADVRTVPRSRTNPQYNRDVLPQTLEQAGIGYEHIAALGGLRGKRRNVPPVVNAFWQNPRFHNYADYALGEEFHSGLTQLRALGQTSPVRSCAPNPYGGGATGGLSQII
jgi:uncharacterized protein (DUF488 family)